ncbi:MAG TPA: SIS domain-containing protein [Rectinemataceae bacterium]|nr:SIS domain-containing protein [Rectinemataceae bacterium]
MEAKRKPDLDGVNILECGRQVVLREVGGIGLMVANLNDDFVNAVRCIMQCPGRVILIGVGKSGHVGKKIAASMASTGTPAFFVHGDEALHGDLGMITKDDLVILLSNSGETREVIADLPSLKRIGATIISITSNANSTMARASNVHLCIGRTGEADHLGLAPSTSSTATMVLGDALALTVSQLRGFTKEQFAVFHPGGKLGEKLTGKPI